MHQSTSQYLERLASLSLLFQAQPLTPHEVCLLVALKLFPDRSACGIGILELSSTGVFSLKAQFGIPENSQLAWSTNSLSRHSPVYESMMTSETVVVSSVDEMLLRYPEYSATHSPECLSSVIAVPIRKLGSATGALLITGIDAKANKDYQQFLEIVAGLIALKLDTSLRPLPSAKTSHGPELHEALTKRELLVQEMMQQGMTNAQIGEALGYSDSTIRQDAVSLFIKLGVHDRKSAGDMLDNE